MTRSIASLTLLLAITATLFAAAPVPADPTRDLNGARLPKGAVARLGWPPIQAFHATFTSDSKRLVEVVDTKIRGWDAVTGLLLPPEEFPSKLEPRQHVAIVSAEVCGEYVLRWLWKPREVPLQAGQLITDPHLLVSRLADGETVSCIPCGHVHHPRGSNDYWGHRWSGNNVATADGKRLAMMIDHPTDPKACGIGIFNLDTGKLLQSFPLPNREAASFVLSPKGTTLFLMERGKPVRRFDADNGKELDPLADSEAVGRIEISADEKQLVAWEATSSIPYRSDRPAYGNKHLAVYNLETGKRVGRLEIGDHPLSFGFAGNDGFIVLTGSRRSYRNDPQGECVLSRWNVSTQEQQWKVTAPPSHSLTVSPDGKRCVLFNTWEGAGMPYNGETGKMTAPLGHVGPVTWVGWSADAETVTTIGKGQVINWTSKGEVKSVHAPDDLRRRVDVYRTHGAGLSWIGRKSDKSIDEVIGWDSTKNDNAWRILVTDYTVIETFSHDGNVVVGIGWNPKTNAWGVRRYDGTTGKVTELVNATLPGTGQDNHFPLPVALSGDGKVFCMYGTGVFGIDTSTGKELFRYRDPGNHEQRSPIAASSDGKRVALVFKAPLPRELGMFQEYETIICVLDTTTGRTLSEHSAGKGYVTQMQFSPDGRRLAVDQYNHVLVCDTETSLVEPRKLEATTPKTRGTCLAFSPNGAKLAVGYPDGTVLIWDMNAK